MGDAQSVTDKPENSDTAKGKPALSIAQQAKIERFLQSQRARPQARALPSASMAVNRVMKPLARSNAKSGGARGSSALSLAPIWPEIMGPRWSKISTPVRFKASNGARTLVISAPGPAASLIMAASGPIMDRLNAHLGAGHVQKLQIVQALPKTMRNAPPAQPKHTVRGLTPREERALQDGLTQVQNDRLKGVLERLGREVIRKS